MPPTHPNAAWTPSGVGCRGQLGRAVRAFWQVAVYGLDAASHRHRRARLSRQPCGAGKVGSRHRGVNIQSALTHWEQKIVIRHEVIQATHCEQALGEGIDSAHGQALWGGAILLCLQRLSSGLR